MQNLKLLKQKELEAELKLPQKLMLLVGQGQF